MFLTSLLLPLAWIGCTVSKPDRPIVADADVRGCSPTVFDSIGKLDVVVVIDTSHSTLEPSGADIDGDGVVGTFDRSRYTDRDDSRLAAEIAALRQLFQETSGRDVRYSIVTYDGASLSPDRRRSEYLVGPTEGRIRSDLTTDTSSLNAALDEIEQIGSGGATIFYAGMHHANKVLTRYPAQGRRRIVLFMSDSPTPFQRHPYGSESGHDPRPRRRADGGNTGLDTRMEAAARKAISESIVFHTFGLSSDASTWSNDTISLIAGATGGGYHAVEDPTQFYCHLVRALMPANRAVRPGQTRLADGSGDLNAEPRP
jgi:hypothetical protein